MLKPIIGLTAFAAIAAPVLANDVLVTIMDEDFESYLSESDPQAAVDAVWGPGSDGLATPTYYQFYSAPGNEFNYPTNAVTTNNTVGGSASLGFGSTPAGGIGSKVLFADIPGLDTAYHNYVPTDENPLFVSVDIFDSGQGNLRRTLGLRQGGGAANITELGFYNSFPNSVDMTERFPALGIRQILWDDAGAGTSGPNYLAFDLTTENLDDENNPIYIQIEDPENPGTFIDSDDSSIPNAPAANFIPEGEAGVWHTFTATIGATEQVFTLDYLADGIVDAEMVLTGNAPSEEGFGEVRIGGPSFVTSGGDPVYWDNILIQVLEAETAVPGDANGDGTVDLLDLSILATNFDGDNTPYGVEDGDFNGDGYVDLLDLSILASNFTTASSVPEPAAAGLLGLGALGLVRRR